MNSWHYKRFIILFFFGSLSPIIGTLIFLVQLHLSSNNYLFNITIQMIFALIFLLYFWVIGRFCSNTTRVLKDTLTFFAIPLLFLVFNHIILQKVVIGIPIRVLLQGLDAPFHYFLPTIYNFSFDKLNIIARILPTIFCVLTFCFGIMCNKIKGE